MASFALGTWVEISGSYPPKGFTTEFWNKISGKHYKVLYWNRSSDEVKLDGCLDPAVKQEFYIPTDFVIIVSEPRKIHQNAAIEQANKAEEFQKRLRDKMMSESFNGEVNDSSSQSLPKKEGKAEQDFYPMTDFYLDDKSWYSDD